MTEQNQKINQKRTLHSTLTLLAVMLATSARDAGEKAFEPVADAILGLESQALELTLGELLDQGYLETDNNRNIRVSKFGEKIALSATHNTPNFERLASGSTNTAFAMLFAAFTQLRDKHLVGQAKIVAGNSGNQLVNTLRELVEFFEDRLTVDTPPVIEKKTATKKTKPQVEVEELQSV